MFITLLKLRLKVVKGGVDLLRRLGVPTCCRPSKSYSPLTVTLWIDRGGCREGTVLNLCGQDLSQICDCTLQDKLTPLSPGL